MPSHDPDAPHAGHDLLVVAAHTAGDTGGVEAARARELIAGCGQCRDLAADLAALRAASRQLPPPQRSRDFRLSPETAARLRDRSPWRRIMDGITNPGGFGRPLAATLMTLGLAGLMVSAGPWAPFGATSATRDNAGQALAPSDAGAGFSGGAAPEVAAPSGAPGDRTTPDTSTGGGVLDTAKGAPGAAGASPSPAVPPAAIVADPSGAGQAATPGAGASATPGAVSVASSAGSRTSASPGALAANGGAEGAQDATLSTGWSGPPPLSLLSAALLVIGLAIFVALRRARSPLA